MSDDTQSQIKRMGQALDYLRANIDGYDECFICAESIADGSFQLTEGEIDLIRRWHCDE